MLHEDEYVVVVLPRSQAIVMCDDLGEDPYYRGKHWSDHAWIALKDALGLHVNPEMRATIEAEVS